MKILVPFYSCDARVERCTQHIYARPFVGLECVLGGFRAGECLTNHRSGSTAYFNGTWHFCCHNQCDWWDLIGAGGCHGDDE